MCRPETVSVLRQTNAPPSSHRSTGISAKGTDGSHVRDQMILAHFLKRPL